MAWAKALARSAARLPKSRRRGAPRSAAHPTTVRVLTKRLRRLARHTLDLFEGQRKWGAPGAFQTIRAMLLAPAAKLRFVGNDFASELCRPGAREKDLTMLSPPDPLPIGLQIVAAPWREDIALRAAFALEQMGAVTAPRPQL